MELRDKIAEIIARRTHRLPPLEPEFGMADDILAIPEIKEALGKCCDGGPQWGHAFDCRKCPD